MHTVSCCFRVSLASESRKSKISLRLFRPLETTAARSLFLQGVHVSGITPVACLWCTMRAIAYCTRRQRRTHRCFYCHRIHLCQQLAARRRSRWDRRFYYFGTTFRKQSVARRPSSFEHLNESPISLRGNSFGHSSLSLIKRSAHNRINSVSLIRYLGNCYGVNCTEKGFPFSSRCTALDR